MKEEDHRLWSFSSYRLALGVLKVRCSALWRRAGVSGRRSCAADRFTAEGRLLLHGPLWVPKLQRPHPHHAVDSI